MKRQDTEAFPIISRTPLLKITIRVIIHIGLDANHIKANRVLLWTLHLNLQAIASTAVSQRQLIYRVITISCLIIGASTGRLLSPITCNLNSILIIRINILKKSSNHPFSYSFEIFINIRLFEFI